MAGIARAKSFWKTIRGVSVSEIAREAQRPFAIAVVGDRDRRAQVERELFPDAASEDVIPERSLIRAFDSTDQTDGFPEDPGGSYLVIDAGGGRSEVPTGATVYSVEELGGWDRVAERIITEHPDLALSMARRFPGLRRTVAENVIKETALANAEFAMLNALPGVIPIIAPLLPVAAIGDVFMLTKNQAMMLFRLAAAHDLPLDARARSRDLVPLLGNALGWRAIAREVVGVVPGGVGLVARGAIAYAGTVALGKAILRFYETGQQPTRAQINRFYKEAYQGAKRIAQERLRAIRGSRRTTAQITAKTDEQDDT
jgi:uncharacterized protein (DUF697 family)